MLNPFFTYSKQQSSFTLHSQQLSDQIGQQIHYISLIDVKPNDLRAVSYKIDLIHLQTNLQSHHGIFISEVLQDNNKKFRFLYLNPLDGKFQQKYQDLFAHICITVSNVCIFNISSKYTRCAQQISDSQFIRSNYLILNTHGAQLYNVRIQRQSNKLQISDKVKIVKQQMIPIQLSEKLDDNFNDQNFRQAIQRLSHKIVFPKNSLNFQQVKTFFLYKLRLQKYLHQNSNSYQKLIQKHNKLSLKQMGELQQEIREFQVKQMSEYMYKYLARIKLQIIEQLISQNHQLLHNFIDTIKLQHTKQINAFQQLYKKQREIGKYLNEYGIQKQYISIIFQNKYIQLYQMKINNLNKTIKQQQNTINNDNLTNKHLQYQIQCLNTQISKLQKQNNTFKQLNQAFSQTTIQLDRQRQLNKKNRIQIQSLIIQRKARIENQQRLQGIITRVKQQKDILKKGLEDIAQKNKQLEHTINKLQQDNLEKQKKLSHYHRIQCEAIEAVQYAEHCKQKIQKYQNLLKGFQQNLQSFKTMQIEKMNYMLTCNYNKFQLKLAQNKQLRNELKRKDQQIHQMSILLEQSKMMAKYFQKLMFQNCQNSASLPIIFTQESSKFAQMIEQKI